MNKQLFVLVLTVVLLPGCGARKPVADAPTTEPAVAPPSDSAPSSGNVASADGVKIAYTAHRSDSSTLVLVHGWMCDQGYWSEQVPVLAEGFGVVTIDLAGHGASGTDRGQWSIGSLGDDVVAVVDHLGLERVIVVGHSMGGLVALDVARKRPGTVIGVIGIDTLHDAGEKNDPAQTEPLLSGMETDFATTCNGFVRGMFVKGTAPGLVDPIVADMCGGPGKIGAALLRAYVAFDVGAAFAEAGVPIHVVNSDMWPTAVEGNRKVADFRHTILSGRGHFLMQEAPRELSRAIIEAATGIAAGNAAEPTAGKKTVTAAATPGADLCAGRSAQTVEWDGMAHTRRKLGCANGKPIVEIEWVAARDESEPPQSAEIDDETWLSYWRALDATPWRTLPDSCPPHAEDAEPPNTGVDYEITDGKTTKKVSCNGEMSDAHVDVYNAVFAATKRFEDEDI